MSMCLALLAVFISAAEAPEQPQTPRDKAATEELQRLQGNWKFESLEKDGAPAAAKEFKDRTLFIGGGIFVVRQGSTMVQAGELHVDPTKKPKIVNATVMLGQHKGNVMLGIYEQDGDTLKLCLDAQGLDRPKEFKTAADSDRTFIVARRVRPKDEQIDIVGKYQSECMQLDGTKFVSEVTIDRHGEGYLVTYWKGKGIAYVGVGLRQGDVFSMSWANAGQVGITTYKIEPGPRLVGQYTNLGGPGITSPETLTRPKKKMDVRLR